jgi:hypothetical protein
MQLGSVSQSSRWLWLSLLAMSVVLNRSAGDTMDYAFTSVAFLRQVETRVVDGQANQVWLRSIESGELRISLAGGSGSGLLCVANNHCYLVTAAHVARALSLQSQIVVRGANDTPISALLWTAKLGTNSWFYHTNADVAVIPLTPSPALSGHFFPLGAFADKPVAPSRDMQLTAVGFPLGLGTDGKFSPNSRISVASSGLMTLKTPATPSGGLYFLLQDPFAAGYSGAPVFDLGGAGFRGGALVVGQLPVVCWGICHGVLADETGGKMGVVVPGYIVREFLEGLDVRLHGSVSSGDAGDEISKKPHETAP